MDESNEYYELPCNRFYNFFHFWGFKFLLFILIAIAIAALSFLIEVKNLSSIIPILIIAIIYGIILTVIKVLSFPKFIDVNQTTVKFEIRHSLLNFFTDPKHSKEETYKYTISEIEKIRFYQNSIEKINNVGSIEFTGRIIVGNEDKYDSVTVRGVKDFEDMSNWIINHVKTKSSQDTDSINH